MVRANLELVVEVCKLPQQQCHNFAIELIRGSTVGKVFEMTSVTGYQVKPSYLSIKLAELLNIVPLRLELRTRRLRGKCTKRSKWIYLTWLILVFLKDLQLLYALVNMLIQLSNGESELAVLLLTTLYGSAVFTATFWNYELFLRARNETVILFNSIAFADSVSEIVYFSDDRMLPPLIPVRKRLMCLLKSMVKAVFGTMESIFKCLKRIQSFSGALLILCPFATHLFVPIYLTLLVLHPEWKAFLTSLVFQSNSLQKDLASIVALGVFEAVTFIFTLYTIMFTFFLNLALQNSHFTSARSVLKELR